MLDLKVELGQLKTKPIGGPPRIIMSSGRIEIEKRSNDEVCIQCLLLESVKDEDIVIKDMVELMMEKFDRYCGEYSVVLTFGAILEPRMKLKTLGYCYEKINPLGK